ncbi:NAD-binding protein [Phellopilus nigrolimitatus]|nr:NAD-binding protein [Phellopilus nigrolimitatus]
MSSFLLVPSGIIIVYFVSLYVQHNDRCLTALPPEAIAASPRRWTDDEDKIKEEYARADAQPIEVLDGLPPRTNRKYLITGGAGFLGGWLVVHLLQRGERRIRVLDICAPSREDLRAAANRVDFRICDISDADAVQAAFAAPWPDDDDNAELTIFHTAANIRFYERAWSLVSLSAAVNVRGTQNVLDAARAAGATVLVSTSSGSVCVRRSRFWLWPWEVAPPFFVQRIDDDDALVPTRHEHFFSNYAYTKRLAEALVRRADGSPTHSPSGADRKLRTGCLRPGNGIYGPGGDVLCGAALVRELNPTWIAGSMQNFIYVENASLAHLCYEQRLIALQRSPATGFPKQPDIGGQAFCIADAGPPPTYGDVYHALSTLTGGRVYFPALSPTLMLALAHIFELVHLSRHYLALLPYPLSLLSHLIPRLPDDLLNLQPSLFALVSVHMLFDDSRARQAPSAGGLGYAPRWTTLQGVCALVRNFEHSGRREEARQRAGGGIGFGTWVPKRMPTPQSVSLDLDVQAISGVREKVKE